MKLKKGDQVEIITGKDSGKRGAVLHIFRETQKVVVHGANIITRHIKARRDGEKGQRVAKEAPVHISNVMLVCPHTNQPTRVGYKMEGQEKVRVSKQSGKVI